jgi:glycosyltransferase involved in cell wall biosynthesis
MIYLFAPPAKGRLSGGFRVNAALVQRLLATETGMGIAVAPDQIPAKIQSLSTSFPAFVVLDSLYLTFLDPLQLAHALAKLGEKIHLYFLLHFLPSLDLFLSPQKRAALQAREHALLSFAEGVFTPGPNLASHLKAESLYTGPIHLCPPGIELSDSKALAEDPWRHDPRPHLITVGPLNRSKGQLEILACLEQILPPFRGSWRLFGDLQTDPETYHRFEAQREISPLKSTLHLCPSVPHTLLSRALAGADLLISASRFESYGMAIAEAAAAGIPVLAYQVGEASQWIKNSVNGQLIPVGDTTSFQAALESLLTEPEKLQKWQRQAQELSRKMSFPTWETTFRYFLAGCRL